MEFKDYFRAWRCDQGLTQEQAGKILSVGRDTIRKYEKGRLPHGTVRKWHCAKILKVDYETLYGEPDPRRSKNPREAARAEIGHKIWTFRRDNNLRQQDLAEMLGVHPEVVSSWECGVSCPKKILRQELVDLMDTEYVEMFGVIDSLPYQLDPTDIGRELLSWRLKHHLSQQAVAKLLGVYQRMISIWENGIVIPQQKTREKIRKLIGGDSSRDLKQPD